MDQDYGVWWAVVQDDYDDPDKQHVTVFLDAGDAAQEVEMFGGRGIEVRTREFRMGITLEEWRLEIQRYVQKCVDNDPNITGPIDMREV